MAVSLCPESEQCSNLFGELFFYGFLYIRIYIFFFLLFQDVMTSDTVGDLMRGLASQLSEKEDVILCSDVRNKLFGPLEFSRRDLGESNVLFRL